MALRMLNRITKVTKPEKMYIEVHLSTGSRKDVNLDGLVSRASSTLVLKN